jgi:hypothetical protein
VTALLVFRRLVNFVDYDHLILFLGGCQSQAELLLQSGRECESTGVSWIPLFQIREERGFVAWIRAELAGADL